jgi:hypothetical protein
MSFLLSLLFPGSGEGDGTRVGHRRIRVGFGAGMDQVSARRTRPRAVRRHRPSVCPLPAVHMVFLSAPLLHSEPVKPSLHLRTLRFAATCLSVSASLRSRFLRLIERYPVDPLTSIGPTSRRSVTPPHARSPSSKTKCSSSNRRLHPARLDILRVAMQGRHPKRGPGAMRSRVVGWAG